MNGSKRTTSAAWVGGIASMLESQGLDPRALFEALAIDPALLGRSDARVETEKLNHLWELAAERSGNPHIALTAPCMAQLASFEVLGYAMMSCPNLLAGLERLARYLRIVTEAGDVRLEEVPAGWRLAFELFDGEHPVPPPLAPCSGACRKRAPPSSNCWTARAVNSRSAICGNRRSRSSRPPTCSASRTRASSIARASGGSTPRRAATAVASGGKAPSGARSAECRTRPR
ncbi:Arabinose-binding domain of AraC transcription regulator, N-term [Variovorax sp. HW608]|nr:AraC family transcriptional regulator ligand-binding domain-containing protein [Variovorax sp. HW608]SCK25767.1 Arabinose-binding domain of AraC transcription regulator, N-term [Variovorax sp. HW608]